MRRSFVSATLSVALVVIASLAVVPPAAAGPVIDARRLVFAVSPDDQVLDAYGSPLVTRYELEVFRAGSNTLVESVNLGKPTPNPDGTVTLQLLPLLYAPLPPDVTYDAVVRAIGPGGQGDSDRSNAFIFTPPPCDPWISPTSLNVEFSGGLSATYVHAAPQCSWTATSNDPWLTIVSGRTGSGNRAVIFFVAPNRDRFTRNGSLTIAGSRFRVNQDGLKQCGGNRGSDGRGGRDDCDDKRGKDGR